MVERFIKTDELCYLVGLGRHSIANLIKEGKFPGPIKVGKRINGWLYSDIEKWILERANKGKDKE
jgi:predicted DNA-binding transcriptional regulator AlpA